MQCMMTVLTLPGDKLLSSTSPESGDTVLLSSARLTGFSPRGSHDRPAPGLLGEAMASEACSVRASQIPSPGAPAVGADVLLAQRSALSRGSHSGAP